MYGLPMLIGYKVTYDYFIDPNSGQFKAPINQLHNEARVYTFLMIEAHTSIPPPSLRSSTMLNSNESRRPSL